MGPEGGHNGGTVVAFGTPEEVAFIEGSLTGKFLHEVLFPKDTNQHSHERTLFS
jgi:excinuclease ABC subunit A